MTDIEKARNCIVYDDEEGFYIQATVEKIAKALAKERLEALEMPEISRLFIYSKHSYHCAGEMSDDGQCSCGFYLALSAFSALKDKLKKEVEGK